MATHTHITTGLLPATPYEPVGLLGTLRTRRSLLPAGPGNAPGPVTAAIRGLRPNEMPSWEIREAEMRRQEAADLLALRRRVAKAVAQGIDFLDATGGDPDAEPEETDTDAGDEPEMENEHGSDDAEDFQ